MLENVEAKQERPPAPNITRKSVEKDFQRLAILGEGTYGVVYKARHRQTGRIVALKQLRLENATSGIPATSMREIFLLKQLQHENVVPLLGIHCEPSRADFRPSSLHLEFEYIEDDLRKFMKRYPRRRIPLRLVKEIMFQLLLGVAFCHTKRVVHRDLKPGNILLSVNPCLGSNAEIAAAGSALPLPPRISMDHPKAGGLDDSTTAVLASCSPTPEVALPRRQMGLPPTLGGGRSRRAQAADAPPSDSKDAEMRSLDSEDSLCNERAVLCDSLDQSSANLVYNAASVFGAAIPPPPPSLQIRLADFGLARIFPNPSKALTHEVVTLWYRAPEIILGLDTYGCAVDMWSVGCILLELIYGRAVFTGETEIDTLYKMFQLLGTPTSREWPSLEALPEFQRVWPVWPRRKDRFDYLRLPIPDDKHESTSPASHGGPDSADGETLGDQGRDLLDSLLAWDPAVRIGAREALSHPWFDNIDTSASDRMGLRLPQVATTAQSNFWAPLSDSQSAGGARTPTLRQGDQRTEKCCCGLVELGAARRPGASVDDSGEWTDCQESLDGGGDCDSLKKRNTVPPAEDLALKGKRSKRKVSKQEAAEEVEEADEDEENRQQQSEGGTSGSGWWLLSTRKRVYARRTRESKRASAAKGNATAGAPPAAPCSSGPVTRWQHQQMRSFVEDRQGRPLDGVGHQQQQAAVRAFSSQHQGTRPPPGETWRE